MPEEDQGAPEPAGVPQAPAPEPQPEPEPEPPPADYKLLDDRYASEEPPKLR